MSKIGPTLDERLLPAQVRLLRRASDASAQHGVALFLVGGTVRDVLLGDRPIDLDLSAVAATPQFASSLAREVDARVVARSQFGTAKLKVGDVSIDLATARNESYARPGALPEVSPGSIEDDLRRRDFSINAMAISLAPDDWGALVDPFGGRRDLERGLIRVLHAQSFVDDATRILRAARYGQRLGFRIEEGTESLLARDLAYLDTIKGDRVRHELERIFREDKAASILRLAQELGVLSAVYPTLSLDETALANLQDIRSEPEAERALLFVSVLACSVPADDHPGLIARLNMDTRWARTVRDTGSVRESLDRLKEPDLRPGQLYGMLRRFDTEAIEGCRLATDDPLVAQRLKTYLTELSHVKTGLNGDDLIALGVPRGPTIGKLLEDLLAARLDGLVATREDEEDFVSRRLADGPG